MSSRELETSKISLVMRTRENSDAFHWMKYIWYSPHPLFNTEDPFFGFWLFHNKLHTFV